MYISLGFWTHAEHFNSSLKAEVEALKFLRLFRWYSIIWGEDTAETGGTENLSTKKTI